MTRQPAKKLTRLQLIGQMIFDGRGKPQPPANRPAPAQWQNDAITGSCLGHSTVYLNFLGVRVENFTHIAAVTPSPGLGVIFYYFRGELRVSIIHATDSTSTAGVASCTHYVTLPGCC